MRKDHPAVREHDIEIRITGGLHEQIDVQVVRRCVEVAGLASSGYLTARLHASHRHIFHLNTGLAGKGLLEWLEGTRKAARAINDQPLIGGWRALCVLGECARRKR